MSLPPCVAREECLLLACDVAVRRALEVASKRMLTRKYVGRVWGEEPHLLYVLLPAVTDTAALDKLFAGAWTSLPEAITGIGELVPGLEMYVRGLVESGTRHDPEYLWPVIRSVLDA